MATIFRQKILNLSRANSGKDFNAAHVRVQEGTQTSTQGTIERRGLIHSKFTSAVKLLELKPARAPN